MEISISEKIEGEFRERAMQTFGYRKGALKEALEEAIADWLKKAASQSDKGGKKKK